MKTITPAVLCRNGWVVVLLFLAVSCVLSRADLLTYALNEKFADANRDTSSLPASAQWYFTGSASNLAVSGNLLNWKSTESVYATQAVAYFAPSTAPVSLAVGESLVLTYTFTVPAAGVNDIANGWRVGLFNSGTSRLSAGQTNTVTMSQSCYAPVTGYAAFLNLGATTTTAGQIGRRAATTTGANSYLMGAGQAPFIGTAGPGKALEPGKTYVGKLRMWRRSDTTMQIDSSLNGCTVSTTDANLVTSAFDTLAICVNTNTAVPPTQRAIESFTISSVSVVKAVGADTVALSDSFDGPGHVTENLPASAKWYFTSASVFSVSGGNLNWTTPSNAGSEAIAYFTDNGYPLSLTVGESITLAYTFTVPSSSAINNIASGIRIGLFDSGGSRVPSTQTESMTLTQATFAASEGYALYTNPGLTSATSSQFYRRAQTTLTDSGTYLMGSSYATGMPGTGQGPANVLGKSRTYTGTLRIWLRSDNLVQLDSNLNGATVTTTDTNPVTTTFDTVAIALCATNSQPPLGTFQLNSVSVTKSVTAIPTFHSVGLYWGRPIGSNSASTTCEVKYRRTGSSAGWKSAQSLWYDDRNKEYRGSIVNLSPATSYDVQLDLKDGNMTQTTFTTWDENLTTLSGAVTSWSGTYTTPLTTSQGGLGPNCGMAAAQYAVYDGGSTGTVALTSTASPCITVAHSYVILRNMRTIGGRNGIVIQPGVHDVIIEDCDISGWGAQNDADYVETVYNGRTYAKPVHYAQTLGGIACTNASASERFIIQRNKIHDPKYGSNSWAEFRKSASLYSTPMPFHPQGPQAIDFEDSKGNNVIRYNECFSNEDTCFNDGMGGCNNFSDKGFPGPDTDVYCNYVANVCDDALEIEGSGRNVRVFNNYFENTFVGVASIVVQTGPLYIFRNVMGVSRCVPIVNSNPITYHALPALPGDLVLPSEAARFNLGAFSKTGDSRLDDGTISGQGRRYFFHNTVLQPTMELATATGSVTVPHGAGFGIGDWSNGGVSQVVSRNNILQVVPDAPHFWAPDQTYKAAGYAINDAMTSATRSTTINNCNYDIYNWTVLLSGTQEVNGWNRIGVSSVVNYAEGSGFDSANRLVSYFLGSDAAKGAAVALDNFNSALGSNTPDVGALQTGVGSLPIAVGVGANYKTSAQVAEPAW